MNRLLSLGLPFLLAACAQLPPTADPAARLAEVRRDFATDLDRGDLDAVLAAMDTVAEACRAHAPYHALRGRYTLALAEQARAAGRQGTGFLLQDAVTALQRALELDAGDCKTRLRLVQALRDANQDQAATAQLAAARPGLAALAQRDALDTEDLATWAAAEQQADSAATALEVLLGAVQRRPEDPQRLDLLVTFAAAHQQWPAALAALQPRRDATGLWYRGRLLYLQACAATDPVVLQSRLDAAMDDFRASMQANPDYQDTAGQWLAMCLGKKGNAAFRAGDDAHAEAWLLEALRRRPDLRDVDLGQSDTIKLGLLRLGFRIMRDTPRTEALFRAAAAAAPTDLDLLNNAAVYARDLGVKQERAGHGEAAAKLYADSYAAYQQALQFDPTSVRLRNDCALIAIHHLDRDWDRSRSLLEGAIRDGEQALREQPPTDARELQDLDEAVGDCYENLALWHLKHSKDADAARAAARHSLEHHPRDRREGALRHLRAAEAMGR